MANDLARVQGTSRRPLPAKGDDSRARGVRARTAFPTRLTGSVEGSRACEAGFKAHTGFEPVSREIEVPEPLRRKLAELRVETDRRSRRGSG
jgi:hypothetical protein